MQFIISTLTIHLKIQQLAHELGKYVKCARSGCVNPCRGDENITCSPQCDEWIYLCGECEVVSDKIQSICGLCGVVQCPKCEPLDNNLCEECVDQILSSDPDADLRFVPLPYLEELYAEIHGIDIESPHDDFYDEYGLW